MKTPVYAIALITAVCLFGDSMLYVALPTHYHEVGITSLFEVGVLLSVNRLVRLPLNPIIGFLYRKMTPQQGILIAIVLAGLTTSSYGIAKGFWVWIVLRAFWGIAWSLFKIGAFLLILNVSENDNRGSLMGRYNGLYRLGSLVGMLGGGFFADQFGIGKLSLVFGAAAFLAIPAAVRYIPSMHGSESRPSVASKATKQWWVNRGILWVLASGLLGSMALDGLLTATLSHVIALRHPTVEKWLWMTLGASTIAGTMQAIRWFLGPWISPWIGKLSDRPAARIRILAYTFGSSAILMAMIPLHTSFMIWIGFIFILLLVSSLVSTVSDSVATDVASTSSSVSVMTTYAIALDVGAAIGPSLGYGMETLFGSFSMYWVSSAVLACLTIKWTRTALDLRRVQKSTALPLS